MYVCCSLTCITLIKLKFLEYIWAIVSKEIRADVPDDAHKRLKVLKAQKGLTWKGVLVYAAEELAGDVEVEA